MTAVRVTLFLSLSEPEPECFCFQSCRVLHQPLQALSTVNITPRDTLRTREAKVKLVCIGARAWFCSGVTDSHHLATLVCTDLYCLLPLGPAFRRNFSPLDSWHDTKQRRQTPWGKLLSVVFCIGRYFLCGYHIYITVQHCHFLQAKWTKDKESFIRVTSDHMYFSAGRTWKIL